MDTAESTPADESPSPPPGVPFDGRTHRRVAYLLVRFPLGVAYFTVFVTLLALGIGLAPLGVGVAVLAGTLGLAEYVAVVEAGLLRSLLGRSATVTTADPNELPAVEYLKTVATRRRNYALVAYALASFFVGVAAFVVVVTGLALALALLVAPLVFWVPGVRYGTTDARVLGYELPPIDGLPEALVASVVGAALLIAALSVFDAAGRALGAVTERVISGRK
jgi:hypothetical protein